METRHVGKREDTSTTRASKKSLMLVSRNQWGAVMPLRKESLQDCAELAVIHHTALWSCCGPQDHLIQLRHIQKLHMQDRGFDDIGYNFLIGHDGTVYEGRGWGVIGAHAKGHNHNSVGIAFMGNFNDEAPSSAALSSIQQLLQCGVVLGHVHPTYTLLGHRDLGDTECPGHLLYKQLQHLSHS
ncbi:peptidoglycan-recognition protein SC2-like [Arapaima gigas]